MNPSASAWGRLAEWHEETGPWNRDFAAGGGVRGADVVLLQPCGGVVRFMTGVSLMFSSSYQSV